MVAVAVAITHAHNSEGHDTWFSGHQTIPLQYRHITPQYLRTAQEKEKHLPYQRLILNRPEKQKSPFSCGPPPVMSYHTYQNRVGRFTVAPSIPSRYCLPTGVHIMLPCHYRYRCARSHCLLYYSAFFLINVAFKEKRNVPV